MEDPGLDPQQMPSSDEASGRVCTCQDADLRPAASAPQIAAMMAIRSSRHTRAIKIKSSESVLCSVRFVSVQASSASLHHSQHSRFGVCLGRLIARERGQILVQHSTVTLGDRPEFPVAR